MIKMKSAVWVNYHIGRKLDAPRYVLVEGAINDEENRSEDGFYSREQMNEQAYPDIDFLEANHKNPLLILVDYIIYE